MNRENDNLSELEPIGSYKSLRATKKVSNHRDLIIEFCDGTFEVYEASKPITTFNKKNELVKVPQNLISKRLRVYKHKNSGRARYVQE